MRWTTTGYYYVVCPASSSRSVITWDWKRMKHALVSFPSASNLWRYAWKAPTSITYRIFSSALHWNSSDIFRNLRYCRRWISRSYSFDIVGWYLCFTPSIKWTLSPFSVLLACPTGYLRWIVFFLLRRNNCYTALIFKWVWSTRQIRIWCNWSWPYWHLPAILSTRILSYGLISWMNINTPIFFTTPNRCTSMSCGNTCCESREDDPIFFKQKRDWPISFLFRQRFGEPRAIDLFSSMIKTVLRVQLLAAALDNSELFPERRFNDNMKILMRRHLQATRAADWWIVVVIFTSDWSVKLSDLYFCCRIY